jgi:hypothetical protein
MTEKTRAIIYRVLVVAILALGVFGVISDEQSATFIAVIGGLFGATLASANTSIKPPPSE